MSEKQIITKDSSYSTNNMIADVIKSILKHLISLDDDDLIIEIGTFDNCREYGNTYRAIGADQDYTFCVYEHRNSDAIYINGCHTDEIKSYGPYSGDDKWFSHASFRYDEHYKAAQKLMCFLKEAIDGGFLDKSKQKGA